MLLEIHMVQNHAPANLNRDETGSPKTCVFGGVQRARISSQALKRSIRRSALFADVLEGAGVRTRQLPVEVQRAFLKAGYDAEYAEAAAFKASGFGKNDGRPETRNKKTGEILTAQTMFLSSADIQTVTDALLVAAKGAKSIKDFEKLDVGKLQEQLATFRSLSPDIALFGRMITSRAFRDVEAAIQTAHAISTHRVESEFDFFTAVDDLMDRTVGEETDAGADMMGDVEFNSACFYKYFSIDVDGLVANLTGEKAGRRADGVTDDERAEARKAAAAIVEAFILAAATVSPSGKQNTFASHALPSVVLVEARPAAVPVSYANAFADPVRPNREAGGLIAGSVTKLAEHVERITRAFDLQAAGRWMLAPEHDEVAIAGTERVESLRNLARRAAEASGG